MDKARDSLMSIVIPTYNAGTNFSSLLRSISEQININYDLLVIDSGSEDHTVEIAKTFNANIVHIDAAHFDHGGTRSYAASLTKGEIVIFLTQDTLLQSSDSLSKLVSVFFDKKVSAAFGRQLPHANATLFAKHLRNFNYPSKSYIRSIHDVEKYGVKTAFLSDSYSAYRRIHMDKIGWFKDGLILGEDMYAGTKLLQAGHKLAYVANAMVYHSHNYTLIEEFKRYFDIGVFHKQQNWILQELGGSSGEGFRFVMSEISFIINNKKYLYIFESLFRTAMKLCGYKLGFLYNFLPKKIVLNFTKYPHWWEKELK